MAALRQSLTTLPERTADYTTLLTHPSLTAQKHGLQNLIATPAVRSDETLRACIQEKLRHVPETQGEDKVQQGIIYNLALERACAMHLAEAPELFRHTLNTLKETLTHTANPSMAMIGFIANRLGEDLGNGDKWLQTKPTESLQEKHALQQACADAVREVFPTLGNEIDRMRKNGFQQAM